MSYNPPDPRKNILTVDQLRQNETINEKFSASFRHLEAPTPGPMPGEWPRDYEARLTSTLTDAALVSLSRTRADRAFSADERELVRNHSLVSSTRAIDAIGPDALRHIADRAHRVAAALGNDPSQGSFVDGQTREVVTQGPGGHRISEFHGSTGKWLQPFYHQGVTVRGGLLSRMMVEPGSVYRSRPAQAYAPPPPQLGPQPALMDMIRTAVAAAMPARRGSRKA